MDVAKPEQPFPCPFCQSSRVVLLGSGLVFLHYRCAECSEVWTAMAAPRPAVVRPRTAPPKLTPRVTRKEKLWPH